MSDDLGIDEELEEFERWRKKFNRDIRRILTFVLIMQIVLVWWIIKMGDWVNTPGIISSVFVLAGCRWLLSDKGQTWLRHLRDG